MVKMFNLFRSLGKFHHILGIIGEISACTNSRSKLRFGFMIEVQKWYQYFEHIKENKDKKINAVDNFKLIFGISRSN